MVGRQGQRLARGLFGFGQPARIFQQGPQRQVRAGVIGLEGQGTADQRLTFSKAPLVLQKSAQIVEQGEVLRAQRNGGAQAGLGGFGVPGQPLCLTQIAVRFSILGPQGDGLLQGGQRVGKPTLLLQRNAQHLPGIAFLGKAANQLPRCLFGGGRWAVLKNRLQAALFGQRGLAVAPACRLARHRRLSCFGHITPRGVEGLVEGFF